MDLQNASGLLALGGIAAVVAAGWQHVKVWLQHLSAILIVRAGVESSLTNAVSLVLRRNWKLLPSNSVEYWGLWLKVKGSTNTTLVPFKLPPYKTSIYYRGRSFVMFQGDGQLIGIRGLVNLDELICEAVRHETEVRKNSERQRNLESSRFRIQNVLGAEKGMSARRGHSLGQDSSEQAVASTREPDPQIDTCLMYDRSDLVFDKDHNPFKHLFYDPQVLNAVEDIKTWFTMGDWYEERGIPWRRGFLLSGPPGSGKSKLTQAIAETLRIPLYVFHLTTLSNQEFIEAWNNMSVPCMAVFEDFDAAFDGRISQTEHKTLTFDCVLNQISGVQTKNGVLLGITTNHPEKIDPAISNASADEDVPTRPGRIDVFLHLGYISSENRLKLATKTLRDWPELIEKAVNTEGDLTPAQFEEVCVKLALAQLRFQQALI